MQLEVARKRSDLAMKFPAQTLGPNVIDSRTKVQNGPIALANHTQRLQHIV